jgi:hypothetical protein
MQFYEEGLVPEELHPDWGMWNRRPEASLRQLVKLAIGLEPRSDSMSICYDYRDKAQMEFYKFEEEMTFISETGAPLEYPEKEYEEAKKHLNDANELERLLEKMIKNLYDLARSHLEHCLLIPPIDASTLSGQHSQVSFTEMYASSLYICDFVDWLDAQNIPYPEKLKNCMRMREKPDSSELSSGEKSKLTQENTMLKRLFDNMVKLHYKDEPVSAYAIEKDLKDINRPVDAKTIKKYLPINR